MNKLLKDLITRFSKYIEMNGYIIYRIKIK